MNGHKFSPGRPRALTEAQVKLIMEKAEQVGVTLTGLAEEFSVSRRTISKIIRGEAYADITGLDPENTKGNSDES